MRRFFDSTVFLIPILYIILINILFSNEKSFLTTSLLELKSGTESNDENESISNSCAHIVTTNYGKIRGCANSVKNSLTDQKTAVIFSFKVCFKEVFKNPMIGPNNNLLVVYLNRNDLQYDYNSNYNN